MEGSAGKVNSVGYFYLCFFLFLVPFGFSFIVHYISSVDSQIAFERETKIENDLNQIFGYFTDMTKMREHFLFHLPTTEYKQKTATLQLFNYSLPILGTQEMKLIKSKEESIFRSETEKEKLVIPLPNPTGQIHGLRRRL